MTLWREDQGAAPTDTCDGGMLRTVSSPGHLSRYQALVYLGSGEPGGLSWAAADHLRSAAQEAGGLRLEAWDLPAAAAGELQAALSEAHAAGTVAGHPSASLFAPVLVFCANRARPLLRLLERSAGQEGSAAAPASCVPRPPLLVPAAANLNREALAWDLAQLQDLTVLLRRECPWDRKQTQASIVRYTLEETYELVDAVERQTAALAAAAGSGAAAGAGASLGLDAEVVQAQEDVRGELGDLLFQVYFLAVMAEEAGRYDVGEVASGIHRKLVRRHPHIFAQAVADTAEEVKANWDQIKRHTEGREGIFHHIPAAFPALLLAQKLQARAAEVGFDWPDAQGPLEKVREEQQELEEELRACSTSPMGEGRLPAVGSARVAEEVGDVLFALVNLARKLKVDPELALRAASQRFRDRVSGAESLAVQDGREFAALGLDGQEEYYQRAKSGPR